MCENISVGCWQRRNLCSRRCKQRHHVRQHSNSQHPLAQKNKKNRGNDLESSTKSKVACGTPPRPHTSHGTQISWLCVAVVFFLHIALTQQSVSDMKAQQWREACIHIEGNENDWISWSQQQPNQPDGHHRWPFTCPQWSGGYCVALKWQGCEVTDERVNTQRSRRSTCWKRGKFVVTWVLYFQKQCRGLET